MANELWERTRRAAKVAGRIAFQVMQSLAEAHEKYMEQPAPCAGCRKEYPRKNMRRLYDIPTYADRWYLIFCPDCQERLRAAYRYEGMLQNENRKILAQLRRATEKGLRATLTLDEWVDTLDHFGWKCAYCLDGPYEALEHVIPIELGGGTTADNCVPACKTCNSAKGIRHPDDIRESSRSPVAMARVRKYLTSQEPLFLSQEAQDEAPPDM